MWVKIAIGEQMSFVGRFYLLNRLRAIGLQEGEQIWVKRRWKGYTEKLYLYPELPEILWREGLNFKRS